MFEILNKQILATNVKRLDIAAPNIAKKAQPGQFVSVCPEEGDERIPLTVIEADAAKGTISLTFQESGYTTKKLGGLAIKESLFSILGPLGQPAEIEKRGIGVCIATGVGAAQILPICRALRAKGCKVVGIIGARTKQSIMLEPQMRLSCNKLLIATEDGSYEHRGLATDLLSCIIDQQKINFVHAIGSDEMMEAVCKITKEKSIKTRVCLNPFMVDCMGMCGSCRVKVGGKVVLACIEGPEFDGHEVDFKDLKIRMNAFKDSEICHSQSQQPNQHKSEPKILKKFLSGILKE
jgi:ferredoxin/flavodoxin---NADP+ reductase